MCQRLILNAQIARVVMRDENRNLVEVNPLDWDDDSALLEEHRRNLQARAISNADELDQSQTDASTETETASKEATESKKEQSCGCGGGCGCGCH